MDSGEALDLDISVDASGGPGSPGRITARGEIDVYTSPQLKESISRLIDGGSFDIVVDMEGVRYIDSTGLGVLAGALRKVRERGGTISIVGANPQIYKVFQITGLDKVFSIGGAARAAGNNAGSGSSAQSGGL